MASGAQHCQYSLQGCHRFFLLTSLTLLGPSPTTSDTPWPPLLFPLGPRPLLHFTVTCNTVEFRGLSNSSAANCDAAKKSREFESRLNYRVLCTCRGLEVATGFAKRCAEVGIEVECTAVERPEVDMARVKELVESFGRVGFRSRSFHATSKV